MSASTSLGTILLVEDDFNLRTGLAQILEQSGYTVVCAANGLDALHLMTSGTFRPMLVILDLMLPHMDGLEFRAMQRAIPAIANVPVVVVTGHRDLAGAMQQLKVEHMLNKPIDISRLLETVRRLSTP